MTTEIYKVLEDSREHAAQVQKLAKDLTPQFEEADETRHDGVSLLHVKYSTLMRYNLNMARFALARVRGESITHLASKLVEDSVVLSKLRPIERKLQHHIDLLLKGGQQRLVATSEKAPNVTRKGSTDEADFDDDDDENNMSLRPNPSNIALDDDSDESDTAKDKDMDQDGGVYKPPKLAEVVYDATAERKRERKDRERDRFKERALRSEGIREMVADIKGLPDEVGADGYGDAAKSSRSLAQLRREDESRRKFEEKNLTRLLVTGKDKKRRRKLMHEAGAEGLNGVSDFAGLSSMADRVMGRKSKKARSARRQRDDDENEGFKLRRLDEALEEE